MSEAILLALWVGTALFFIMREIKTNNDRESHEWWLSDLRECLHSIENEFSRRCFEIVKNSQQKYSSYLSQISELQDEYKNEVYNKVLATKRITVKTIPQRLLSEYERNISEIANIYRNVLTINE